MGCPHNWILPTEKITSVISYIEIRTTLSQFRLMAFYMELTLEILTEQEEKY